MGWLDLVYLGIAVVVWYLLVSRVLPKLGIGT
jgi:hypothetical protein